MAKMAALHWQNGKDGPTSMMPFCHLALAEADLAEAVQKHHKAWLEYAHFPVYVCATTCGWLEQVGWNAEAPRKGVADISLNGQFFVRAIHITREANTDPYWIAKVDGETYTAGCLDGVVLEIATARQGTRRLA